MKRARYDAVVWAMRLHEWRCSGMSLSAYCRYAGWSYATALALALALDHLAPCIGKAEFEDVLGEVDGKGGGDRSCGLSMHGGLLW